MTRSLVIGGSGYVGRELLRQLGARDADELHVLGRSQPAADLPATWIEADVTQRESLRAALAGREYDVIYHLASLPGDTGDPLQMVTVNLLG
ncbi:MAG: NAD(P)-dependent oxidoreductase, partial [Anaerolineaceae bacterium]|nr:NAD(P)-dependent oxidoreductase [Anaerolineaceae bacterium]